MAMREREQQPGHGAPRGRGGNGRGGAGRGAGRGGAGRGGTTSARGAPANRGAASGRGRGYGQGRGRGGGAAFGSGDAGRGRGKKLTGISWKEKPEAAVLSATSAGVTNVSVVDGVVSVPKHPCMKLNEKVKGVPYKVSSRSHYHNYCCSRLFNFIYSYIMYNHAQYYCKPSNFSYVFHV